jgi:two-component system LytT family response regulator
MNSAISVPLPSVIRVILVDDERLLREHVRERLEVHPEIEIVGEADGVKTAADLVATTKPDVIFLDVQMPPECGFDLLPLLEWVDPQPLVVFVTAFDRYALKAFDVNAIDYLTKPVLPERMAKTIQRLKQSLADQRSNAGSRNPADAPPSQLDTAPLEERDLIRLQDGRFVRMVKVYQIAAAQAEGNYTRIIAAGGKGVMIRSSLVYWEDRLPGTLFFKISHRLLINRGQVQQIKRLDREFSEVFLHGIDEPLLLSRIEVRRLKSMV